AFGRLLARRLVVPVGARGLVVRNLGASDVLELYALREILEGAAARLAAQHASEPEIQSMNDLEVLFERQTDNPREMARLN
ncbi:FCD domain-containing protein, partial [Stenotrophomonas maltophilia]|uniref:FCD domain-containing protein n=1 Tax=Stenotrophomonas maltophilia TaxID=40324 RepID=UPI0013DD032D